MTAFDPGNPIFASCRFDGFAAASGYQTENDTGLILHPWIGRSSSDRRRTDAAAYPAYPFG
jgi:hypothetical protein